MDKLLPYETISQILEFLKDDQQSLLQLSSCCRKLYKLTIPLLFRSPQFATLNKFESFATTLNETNGLYVRHVDLHMVPHRWDSLKINELQFTLTQKTPELELLNLDLCSQLTNKALIRITKPLHDLRVLSVDQCLLIGDAAITALVVQCPYIQQLYLGSTNITDASLNLIATKMILLTHLYMPACSRISEKGVDILIRECKTLQHFDIRECYNVVGNFGNEVRSQMNNDIDRSVTIQSEDEWEDVDED